MRQPGFAAIVSRIMHLCLTNFLFFVRIDVVFLRRSISLHRTYAAGVYAGFITAKIDYWKRLLAAERLALVSLTGFSLPHEAEAEIQERRRVTVRGLRSMDYAAQV